MIMNPAAKKVKVVIDNVEYVVEVGDLEQSPVSVTVNGKPYTVTWEMLVERPETPRPATPAAPAVLSPASKCTKGKPWPTAHCCSLFQATN
jgi:hypothetical protein